MTKRFQDSEGKVNSQHNEIFQNHLSPFLPSYWAVNDVIHKEIRARKVSQDTNIKDRFSVLSYHAVDCR